MIGRVTTARDELSALPAARSARRLTRGAARLLLPTLILIAAM